MVRFATVSLTVLHRHESRRFDVRCVPPVPVGTYCADGRPQTAQRATNRMERRRCLAHRPDGRNMNTLTRLLHPTELPMLNPLLRLYRSVQKLIEQISEDWAVNHRDWTMPGFRAIAVHRFGTWVLNKRPGMLRTVLLRFYRMLYRYIRNTYGIEIPLTVVLAQIIAGAPKWSGVSLKTVVGDDCLIRHNATIGAGMEEQNPPQGPSPREPRRSGTWRGHLCRGHSRRGCGTRTKCRGDVRCSGWSPVFAEAPRMIRLPNVSRTLAPLKTMPQHM